MNDAGAPATIEIRIPADPARVAVVRRALTHFLRTIAADEDYIADINTAVSEACENSIVHGYPNGTRGPVDVELFYAEPLLRIKVRDQGTGMRPGVEDGNDAPRLRLGLPLMSALSSELQVSSRAGTGTEIMMAFDLAGRPAAAQATPNGAGPVEATELRVANDPGGIEALRPAVLMVAAQTGMTVDRIKDLGLLIDLIGSAALKSKHDPIALRLETPEGRGLRVVLGPFERGEGSSFLTGMSLPMPGGGVERLVDEISVDVNDGGECIVLEMAPPNQP